MVHHTKDKGDLAAIKAMSDLTSKGFDILTPVVSEHLPFDFIGYKSGKLIKFQAKYTSDGSLKSSTSWADKNGTHSSQYKDGDFDYYAAYIPSLDIVCYPSIKFKGHRLKFGDIRSANYFYWYEDFLNLTDEAEKKNFRDFDIDLTGRNSRTPRPNQRKVVRPTKSELEKLIWKLPMSELSKKFGVSDVAIAKWIKSYELKKPPLGYWLKQS